MMESFVEEGMVRNAPCLYQSLLTPQRKYKQLSKKRVSELLCEQGEMVVSQSSKHPLAEVCS